MSLISWFKNRHVARAVAAMERDERVSREKLERADKLTEHVAAIKKTMADVGYLPHSRQLGDEDERYRKFYAVAPDKRTVRVTVNINGGYVIDATYE